MSQSGRGGLNFRTHLVTGWAPPPWGHHPFSQAPLEHFSEDPPPTTKGPWKCPWIVLLARGYSAQTHAVAKPLWEALSFGSSPHCDHGVDIHPIHPHSPQPQLGSQASSYTHWFPDSIPTLLYSSSHWPGLCLILPHLLTAP